MWGIQNATFVKRKKVIRKGILKLILILSIAWIIYAGLNLINFGDSPTPENCFSEQDKSVVVVHKATELDFTNIDLKEVQENKTYMKFLSRRERIQHFYFSISRNLMLLERSKPWSTHNLKNYFNNLQLSVGFSRKNNSFSLSNGWKGVFNGKYLCLFQKKWEATSSSRFNPKYLDLQSSASILKLNHQAKFDVVNYYFIGKDHVKYVAYNNFRSVEGKNDLNVFEDLVPVDFLNYQFTSKEILKRSTKQKTHFFDWMESGLLQLKVKEGQVFVIDYISTQEPIQTIIDEYHLDEISTSSKLTMNGADFPFGNFGENQIVIERFKNFILISENQNAIDHIVGSYETGQTLAQSLKFQKTLFSFAPKKVSKREITQLTHISQSYLNGTIHSVQFSLNNKQETQSTQSNTMATSLKPLRLNGRVVFLKSFLNKGIVTLTDGGKLYGVGKNIILWEKQLSGTFQSTVFVDPSEQWLAFHNGTSLYWFNSNGTQIASIPVLNIQSAPVIYSFKNKTYISCIADNKIQSFNDKGQKSLEIPIIASSNSFLAFSVEKNQLIAHCLTNQNYQKISTSSKRVSKQLNLGEGNWSFVKTGAQISIFGLCKKQFVRVSPSDEKVVLVGNIQQVFKLNQDKTDFYGLVQGGNIYLLNATTGILISQFTTTLRQIEDFSIFLAPNGKTYIGLVDGIANNCYIYTLNGNEVSKKSYEGSAKIAFQQEADGSIFLVSQSNSYLVSYSLFF